MTVNSAILSVLHNSQGNPQLASLLLTEVRITRGECGEHEFQAALTNLRSIGFISSETDQLTGDTRYSITQNGIKYLTGRKG